jgi:hypothetical protein
MSKGDLRQRFQVLIDDKGLEAEGAEPNIRCHRPALIRGRTLNSIQVPAQ